MTSRGGTPLPVAFAATLAALPLLPERWLPMVDLPQHELVADALVRKLASPDVPATALNLFTYNAGFEFAAALLSPIFGTVRAGHVVLTAGAVALTLAIARVRRLLGQNAWPSLLAPALTLHYAAGWGFANFTLGVPLLFVALGDALELRAGRRDARFLARASLAALALAATHVLATLAACIGFALLATPALVRTRTRDTLFGWFRAALPLLGAATFDVGAFLWARMHPHTPWENAWAEGRHDGPMARLGKLVVNTLGTTADRSEQGIVVALVVALTILAAQRLRRPTSAAPHGVLLASLPLGFAALYLVVPTVFVATFYVGERFAALALLAAIATVPSTEPSRAVRGALIAAALLAGLRLELLVRAADASARDGLAVLATIDAEASLLPLNRHVDVDGFARSPLRHLFARHALRSGAAVGYSFLRFESPPVRRTLPPALPDPPPGFEGDAKRLTESDTWARSWDAIFVVDAPAAATREERAYRDELFPGIADELALVARRGRFAAYRWERRRTVETR